MSAHLHMQLSLSMSLVLKSAPWITRLLCLPAVPLWLFRNSLKHIKEEEEEGVRTWRHIRKRKKGGKRGVWWSEQRK